MPIIGADLGAMATLARRFGAAGAEFRAQSEQITQRVATALDEFTGEMSSLDREARALAEQIDQEMSTLRGRAEATAWTGRHRDQQDQTVALLEGDIREVRTTIDGFVDQASGVVKGALTATMNDMRTQARTAGTSAQGVAESFAGGVESQRAAFDMVMNG